MRQFKFNEYNVGPLTVTEEDIRTTYFPRWERSMIAKYGEKVYRLEFTFEDCIADWLTDYQGWEVGW
jgi:hypothetical protein